jgi:hypothetical protein
MEETMSKEWVIRDHFGDDVVERIVAETGDEALDQAGDPADCYDAADEPIFGYWVAVCEESGETASRGWVIPAAEPDCTEELEPHTWQEGQVWGSGGGVRWTDMCLRCGIRRTTDTWSVDPRDGGIYGTTTRYCR